MKKYWAILIVFVSLVLVSGCSDGKVSFDDIKAIPLKSTSKEVIEAIGNPKNKTMSEEEVMDWAPDYLIKHKDEFPNLEMLTYFIDGESDRKARLFFSNDKLIYKHPVGLNK